MPHLLPCCQTVTIDFSDRTSADCADGYTVTIYEDTIDGIDWVLADIDRNDLTGSVTIKTSAKTNDITVYGSPCADVVKIESTLNMEGFIYVAAGDGDDSIYVGTESSGLDSIYQEVFLEGGGGTDSLFVTDAGSEISKTEGFLGSGTISGLMNSFNDTLDFSDLDYSQFEVIDLTLSSTMTSVFEIRSTASLSETYLTSGSAPDTITISDSQGYLEVDTGDEGTTTVNNVESPNDGDTIYLYGLGDNVE